MKLFFVWCVSPKREIEGVAIFWPNYHTWASSGPPHPSPSAPSLVIFLLSFLMTLHCLQVGSSTNLVGSLLQLDISR